MESVCIGYTYSESAAADISPILISLKSLTANSRMVRYGGVNMCDCLEAREQLRIGFLASFYLLVFVLVALHGCLAKICGFGQSTRRKDMFRHRYHKQEMGRKIRCSQSTWVQVE